jgi:hypothetical protein
MNSEMETWNINANKAAEKYADAVGYPRICLERTLVISSFKSGLAYERDLYADLNLSQFNASTCNKITG